MLKSVKEYRARRLYELKVDPYNKFHGTTSGYTFGCRCEACKEAHAEYAYENRQTHKSQAPSFVPCNPKPSGILEAMKARAARENETVEEWP